MKKLLALLLACALLPCITGCPTTTTPETNKKDPKKEAKVELVFIEYVEDTGELTGTVGSDKKTFKPKDVKPKTDNKEVKWKDIPKDTKLTVHTKGEEVTKIDVPKTTPAEEPTKTEKKLDGTFVSYEKDELKAKVGGDTKTFVVKGIKPTGADKWDEIKKDAKLTITTKGDDVTAVEVAKETPPPPVVKEEKVDGTFISYDKEKGELKAKVGSDEKTFKIKDDKLADLKKDDKVTITTKGTDVKVEKAK